MNYDEKKISSALHVWNKSVFTPLTVTILFSLIISIFQTLLMAETPTIYRRKLTGDIQALNIIKQLKSYEVNDSAINGAFVYEITRELTSPNNSFKAKDSHGKQVTILSPKTITGNKTVKQNWAKEKELIRFSRTEMNDDNEISSTYAAAWNGKKGTVFISSENMANLYGNKDTLLEEFNVRDPRGFSLFYSSISTNIQLEGGNLSISHNDYKGKAATVITQHSGFSTREYWLDTAENFVPLRIMTYSNKENKSLESETLINKYILRKDGSWFITEATTNFLNHPEGKMKIHFWTEKIDFTPLTKEFFEIDIPDNTLVHETTSGTSFIAGGVIPKPYIVDAVLDENLKLLEASIEPQHSSANKAVTSKEIMNKPSNSVIASISNVKRHHLPIIYKSSYSVIWISFALTFLLGIYIVRIYLRHRNNLVKDGR